MKTNGASKLFPLWLMSDFGPKRHSRAQIFRGINFSFAHNNIFAAAVLIRFGKRFNWDVGWLAVIFTLNITL